MFPIVYAAAECKCKKECKCDLFKKDEFKLYIQLRRLVDFCHSTYYERDDLDVFNQQVKNFLFNLSAIPCSSTAQEFGQ